MTKEKMSHRGISRGGRHCTDNDCKCHDLTYARFYEPDVTEAASSLCLQGKHEWCANRSAEESHCQCSCHRTSKTVDKLLKRVGARIPASVTPATRIEIHPSEWIALTDEIERARGQLLEARNDIDKLHDIMRGERLPAETAAPQPAEPYLVRTYWSPDRKYLVTAHVTTEGIVALQDDNGTEWEAAGAQQNVASMETTDHSDLLKRAPRVGADFVAEVRQLSRHELERRVLIQKDWLGSYSQCLDGLGLSIGVDACRDPRDIRRVVESLRPALKAADERANRTDLDDQDDRDLDAWHNDR